MALVNGHFFSCLYLAKLGEKKKANNPELAPDIILNFYWFTHIQRCWNPLAMRPRAQVLEGPGATVAPSFRPSTPCPHSTRTQVSTPPGSDPSPWLSGPDHYLAISYPFGSVMVSVFTYSLTLAALLPFPSLTVLEGSGLSTTPGQRTIIEVNLKGKSDSVACKKLLMPYPSLSFSLASEFMEEKPRLLAYIGWHARVLLE